MYFTSMCNTVMVLHKKYLRNIVNLFSIFLSIFFTFSLSNILYDGIELVMIIIPAVIFIITISDFNNLQNISRNVKNKFKFSNYKFKK